MSLTVYCGSMFSGKSQRMLGEITRFSDVSESRHALIINHSLDNRNEVKVVSSHSSLYAGLSNKVDVVSTDKLSTIDVSNYTIIGIDEVNFFSDLDDLLQTIRLWIQQGKHIICAGLDSDFRGKKFGYISELVHLADNFEKLHAICSICLKEIQARKEPVTPHNATPAPFTAKITAPKFNVSDDGSVIDVGGADKYIAVCRRHHPYYNKKENPE